MMEDKTVNMSDDEFWEIVAKTGWAEENADPAVSKRHLRKELPTAEHACAFRNKLYEKANKVCAALEQYEKTHTLRIPLSDDGMADLSAHVVGLGLEVWLRETEEPQHLMVRARELKYIESFAYAVPYEEDYEPDAFDTKTKQRHRDYIAQVTGTKIQSAVAGILREAAEQVPGIATQSALRFYVDSAARRAVVEVFGARDDD